MNEQIKLEESGRILPDAQSVTSVRHWNDHLFSFRVTRPKSLRFRSGEFVMIGLMGDNGRPLLRAYSIASPAWDDELEFYSIKVQDGPLTSRLQNVKIGDQLIVRPKPVGTLVVDALLPGKRLYLLSTGTGIAPFASLTRDPEVFEKFDEVILVQTCRTNSELQFAKDLQSRIAQDPLIGEIAAEKLRFFLTTTREESEHMGRITANIDNEHLQSALGTPALNPETDRVMLCGSLNFNTDLKAMLESRGFVEGANSNPQHFVIEKAFVGEGV